MRCPRCGRTVSPEILVSLSEANRLGGVKNIHCECGQILTYKTHGYDEREKEKEKKRLFQSTAFVELSKPYRLLTIVTYGLSIASAAFFGVCMITTAKNELVFPVKQLLSLVMVIFTCGLSGLFLLIPFFLTRGEIVYPKDVDKGMQIANIAFCVFKRILGFAILAAAIFGFVNSGINTLSN